MPQDEFAFQRQLVLNAINDRLLNIPLQQGFSKFHLKEKYQKQNTMKKYLGVKIVEAEPMYSTDKEKEGYKVVYEDGYVSWSPKEVFEKAYKEVGVVADEKEERAILVNPSTGHWNVVGNVASIEL